MNQNPNTHPGREELTRHLFGETAGEARAGLEGHLGACPECARHVAEMQTTLDRLNRWDIPSAARRRRFRWQPLKWAAAAAILLGAGFGVGRFTMPATPDVTALGAEITANVEQTIIAEFQNQVRAAVRAELETVLAESREDHRQFALALFENLQQEHAGNYLSLRNDLETLATLTEDEMLHARRSILHIAAFAQTAAGESNPK